MLKSTPPMDAPDHHPAPRTATVVACSAFALLYVFPYQANLNNPNENVRFYMTAALAEEGRYEIDTLRKRWGWVNDAAERDGHIYSVKAPGTSFLGVPAYALYAAIKADAFDRTEALWACRVTASVLPALIFALFLHPWLRRQARHPLLADCVFYSVMLGSLLYGYAMLFVSHTASAACAFGGFMILHDLRHGELRARHVWPFAAGLLTAGVTLFEYPGLVASIVLSVYAIWVLKRLRPILGFALGGLVPALVMMHFQWRAFGSPFTPGHLFVENDAYRAIHHEGVYGAVGPSARALHGLLLDLGSGLFPLTPILILSVLGFPLLLRDPERRIDAMCALGVTVLTVLAISSMVNWDGGWTIGPRYLALTLPFVAWAALAGITVVTERIPRSGLSLALSCTLLGFLASGVPSAYYPHLPPEFTRPLPQLMRVLVMHDFAPPNLGNRLGVFGTPSMLPLLGCAVLALLLSLRAIATNLDRLKVGAGALVLALCLSPPLLIRPSKERGVSGAVAFVTRRWAPAGHDRAARLHAELRGHGRRRADDLARLASLYEQEGRLKEARRVRRGKL